MCNEWLWTCLRKAALAATLSVGAAVGATAAGAAPLMRILIAPGAMNGATGKGEVEVSMRIPAMNVAARAPLITLPNMAPGMREPQPITDLAVTDSQGPVPLVSREADGATHWTATRGVRGTLEVRYRLPIDNSNASGPPIDLHIDGDSFSSPGRMLLALPQGKTDYRVAIRWNLSAMGQGARGVTSWGDGRVDLPAGPVERLFYTLFMAGQLERWPPRSAGSFEAVWAGNPPFDPRPTMQWMAKLYRWMTGYFNFKTTAPYRVFLRSNPANPGGGVAMIRSLNVGWGKGVTAENLKPVLAHEMTHTFTQHFDMPKWYNEGIAVYYGSTLLAPWLTGIATSHAFLVNLNKVAATYYTDPKRQTPSDQVLPNFWKDTFIRILPYDRGAMYFAALDAMIRKESGGKRSLADLIESMNERGLTGQAASPAVWVTLLRQELGPAGPALHNKMIAGGLVLPPSDAFGLCFHRIVKKIRQFDLGFAMRSLGARTIQGLRAGSEAARAGLHDGDRFAFRPMVPIDELQSDAHETLTLEVTREGRTFQVTYLPRGKAVDAYQWERVAGISESACKSGYLR